MPRTTSGRKRRTMRRAARRAVGTRYGSARFFQAASRSKPRIRTVASAKPASGTTRSSGPPALPTRSTEPSGLSARNARATASAGNRWPPVPPPVIKSLIRLTIVPQRRPRPAARDAQQHSDAGEGGGQRRAAIAEERQRHAGDRKGVGHGRHVEQGLEGDPRRDRGRQRHAESIGRAQRGPVAADPESQETKHDERRADEAGL